MPAPKTRAVKPPAKPLPQQLAESKAMLEARDAAQQTPPQVRRAFLGSAAAECKLELVEFSLGVLWLFEELKHPFNEGREPLRDAEGKPILARNEKGEPILKDGNPLVMLKPMSMRDNMRAILVWHDPEAAHEALTAGGVEQLDAAAMELALKLSPADLAGLLTEINRRFTEGLATIPGAGASNPPETGS